MGIADDALGIGKAITGVVEVFAENRTTRMELNAATVTGAQAMAAAEFRENRNAWDSFIDGVNRIPRPAMALGTLGLFVYAMADPVGFAVRMGGLAVVPDQLWWLLGAVVTFYFGARESLKFREARAPATSAAPAASIERQADDNPALARFLAETQGAA